MDDEKTIKPYEISFLLKNEEDAGLVVKKLSDRGAEIIKEGTLDQIRLAYPIEGQEAAYFGYVHFNASTDAIVEISAALKLEQKVLRFLVVTPPMEKTIPRRIDFRHPVERSSESTGQAVKTEPLSNAELVEKLEEFSK